MRQIDGMPIKVHALTHVHPDHQGSSHAICERLSIPLWCGEADESDRVLILGDVLNGMNLMTGIPGLHEPPTMFTADPLRDRESARKLAALRPALACFGHGAPLRDPDKLADFVSTLPE